MVRLKKQNKTKQTKTKTNQTTKKKNKTKQKQKQKKKQKKTKKTEYHPKRQEYAFLFTGNHDVLFDKRMIWFFGF